MSDQTTNNPRVEYDNAYFDRNEVFPCKVIPKAGPLLGDEDVAFRVGTIKSPLEAAKSIVHFYERKIASGELMVVKAATWIRTKYESNTCSVCKWKDDSRDSDSNVFDFCPGCGAKIIE